MGVQSRRNNELRQQGVKVDTFHRLLAEVVNLVNEDYDEAYPRDKTALSARNTELNLELETVYEDLKSHTAVLEKISTARFKLGGQVIERMGRFELRQVDR